MWYFYQDTGKLAHNDTTLAQAYSGFGSDKDNPTAQNVPDCGPIPQGLYLIEWPDPNDPHGPYSMRLTPATTNQMWNRLGFWIHGDSTTHPGEASRGCIVCPKPTRAILATCTDRALTVQQHQSS
jgi:hypothetical protein